MTTHAHFNRVQAGLLHLGVSAAVALLALGLVFWAWYPGALADAQGVSRLLLIMIGVDVVLGPVITTVVWNPLKGRWMQFDLVVIATVQTLALLYGLQTIYGGRPAYLVFNVDRFDVVAVQEVDRESLSRANPDYAISWWGPKTVAARMPEDGERRNEILFSSVSGGADLPQLPEFFVPLVSERQAMIQHLHPLDELRKLNELDDKSWKAFLASLEQPEEALGYLPLKANSLDAAVVLDATSGEIRGIHLLTPNFNAPKKENPAADPAPDAPRLDAPAPSATPAPAPAGQVPTVVG